MSSAKKVLVVGSGLASYGACLALLNKKGIKIDVVDIGLDKPYKNQPNKVAANGKDLDSSYYPYGINDKRWNTKLKSNRICSSHAKGGFSKVWSGSILQPKSKDLVGWPKDSIPSSEDYKIILNSINVAQVKDELDGVFPIEPVGLETNKKGIFLGRSRIAYMNKLSINGDLNSIPFDSSYNFQEWSDAGLINYQRNIFVTHIIKNSDNKFVVFIDKSNKPLEDLYDFVFLGSGCVNTTAIVDKSLFDIGRREYLIKSAPFLLQLHLKIGREPQNLKLLEGKDGYGLSEYFLEQCNELTSYFWSHTQISPINKIALEKLYNLIPRNFVFLIKFIRNFFKFSLTTFHSDFSPVISMICEVSKKDKRFRHKIKINEANFECKSKLYNATKFAILSKFNKLRLIPLPYSKFISNFFRANKLGAWHFGGTLPMTEKTNRLGSCSVNGEINGLNNLYIIDTSCFPSIPGSTIGLLTMANSYRIAKKSIN